MIGQAVPTNYIVLPVRGFAVPQWTIAAFTHRGRVRTSNEDAISVDDRILTGDMSAPFVKSSAADRLVLMIADGMGGHACGEVASRATLDHLVAAVERLSDPDTCADVIQEAHLHLFTLMSDPQSVGMGTTLVGAVLTADRLLVFNVGDSRCYLFTASQLLHLSHDDSLGSDRDHRSHALTQSLGGSLLPMAIKPHIMVEPPLAAGESLLLCSDGLTDMVNDDAIRTIVSNGQPPLQLVRSLVGQAFSVGGRDNISVIAVRRSP